MAALDRIEIHDLLVRGIIGITDSERSSKQDILINIVMWADTRPAAQSDAIEDAVNYRTVTKQVIAHVEAAQYYLVERMAARIAEICLANEKVEQVQVSIQKPGALRFARSVGVTIVRTRADLSAANS